MARRYIIKVPCSSANIGPGFDVLGLTLSLHLTINVILPREGTSTTPTIRATGQGADEAPLNPYKNLITRVALYVLRCHNVKMFPAGLELDVHNEIPFGRGLGSSGAAVIAGVLLADAVGQLNLSVNRKLDFALMVERHPDNVAAALLGGFVGSYLSELSPEDTQAASIPLAEVLPEYPPDASAEWGLDPPAPPTGIGHFIRFGWAPEIKAVAIIPRFELSTAKARGALKQEYSLKDCIFNLQRLAVLTTALTRSPPDAKLIYEAMQDRLHQPYRKHLIPALPEILESMSPTSHDGLLGICLSGAGPTILALATHNFDAIGNHVQQFWSKNGGVECDWKLLDITTDGSQCIEEFDALVAATHWIDESYNFERSTRRNRTGKRDNLAQILFDAELLLDFCNAA